MLGLSVGFPAARRLARQRHLAAMPPSMQASDDPMAEQPTGSAVVGRVPQVGQHVDAAPLELGRLGILVLVDQVLVDAEVHQLVDLRLLPGLAERGQVLARVAVEQELVGDRLERVGGPHLVAWDSASTAAWPSGPGRRRPSRAVPRGRSPSCATAWRAPCRLGRGRPYRTGRQGRERLSRIGRVTALRRRGADGVRRSAGEQLQASAGPERVAGAGRAGALRRGAVVARSRDGRPASSGAGAAPWCGSGTPGSR